MSNLLLLRKPEKKEIIAISVPASTKTLWAELSKLADSRGWDFVGSATHELNVWMKRVKGELSANGNNREVPD